MKCMLVVTMKLLIHQYPSCHLAKLEQRKDNSKRQELSETLMVHCLICKINVHIFEISENIQTNKLR